MVRAAARGLGRRGRRVRTGPQTCIATEKAALTPDLCVGEFRAHLGQRALEAKRFRMRGTEDLPCPLDHVLPDCLGFEQVVACVKTKNKSRRRHQKRRSSRVLLGSSRRATVRIWLSASVEFDRLPAIVEPWVVVGRPGTI